MGSKDTVVPTCNSREGSQVSRGGFLQLYQKSIKQSFGIWNNVGRIYYSKCIVPQPSIDDDICFSWFRDYFTQRVKLKQIGFAPHTLSCIWAAMSPTVCWASGHFPGIFPSDCSFPIKLASLWNYSFQLCKAFQFHHPQIKALWYKMETACYCQARKRK